MTNLMQLISNLVFLAFFLGILGYGLLKRLDVFAAFTGGAKQGLYTAIRIFPYLLAMLVAIGMLRASGFFALLNTVLGPFCALIGLPSELLPLVLIRPFSGAASLALMGELIHQHGGNALISKMAATMIGSTETTFYVVAVYFGSVGINKTRHAILAGLLADLSAVIASVAICRYLF